MNRNDIKVVKSAVMNQDDDGGGPRTTNIVTDGLTNEVLPDLGSLDLTSGDVSLSKVYIGVDTDDNSMLSDAHTYLTKPPELDFISVTLFPAISENETRIDAMRRVESFYKVGSSINENTGATPPYKVDKSSLEVGNATLTVINPELLTSDMSVTLTSNSTGYSQLTKIVSMVGNVVDIATGLDSRLLSGLSPSTNVYVTGYYGDGVNTPAPLVNVAEYVQGSPSLKLQADINASVGDLVELQDSSGNKQSNKISSRIGLDLILEQPVNKTFTGQLGIAVISYNQSFIDLSSVIPLANPVSIGDTVIDVGKTTQLVKPLVSRNSEYIAETTIPAVTGGGNVTDTLGDNISALITLRESFNVNQLLKPYTVALSNPTVDDQAIVSYTQYGGIVFTDLVNNYNNVYDVSPTNVNDYLLADNNVRFGSGKFSTNGSEITINDAPQIGTTIRVDSLPSDNYRRSNINFGTFTNGEILSEDANTTITLESGEEVGKTAFTWWSKVEGSVPKYKVVTKFNESGGVSGYEHTHYIECVIHWDDGKGSFKRLYEYEGKKCVAMLRGFSKTHSSMVDFENNGGVYTYVSPLKLDTNGTPIALVFDNQAENVYLKDIPFDDNVIALIDYSTGAVTSALPVGEVLWYESETVGSYAIATKNQLGLEIDETASTTVRTYFSLALPESGYDKSTFYIEARLASDGSLITGSSDSAGNITGAGITSGILDDNNYIDITFDNAVNVEGVRYGISKVVETSLPASLTGIEPYYVPENGEVNVFSVNDYAVIHNTDTIDIPSQVQTINCGRPVDFVDIIDSNGSKLYTPTDDYYSVYKETGLITTKGDWVNSGFIAPFIVVHMISDTSLVTDVNATDNKITIEQPLLHEYPLDNSFISKAMVHGDMQSRIRVLFDQAVWDGVTWSDEIVGLPATASYDSVNYPIETTNSGAIESDFIIKFTSAIQYEVVFNGIGTIASGDTSTDLIVVHNNKVYMTIRAAGFGSGWQAGNIIRGKSLSSWAGVWIFRVTNSTQQTVTTFDTQIQTKGNFA